MTQPQPTPYSPPLPQPHSHAGYKLVIAVLLIAVILLGIGFGLSALPNSIFKSSSSAPSGFTFVHGTVKVDSGNPTRIEFLNATERYGPTSSLSNGGYQITLRSNVLYNVLIHFSGAPYSCNANPGTIVPSGSDKTQGFTC